jgi:hypothetical protein
MSYVFKVLLRKVDDTENGVLYSNLAEIGFRGGQAGISEGLLKGTLYPAALLSVQGERQGARSG